MPIDDEEMLPMGEYLLMAAVVYLFVTGLAGVYVSNARGRAPGEGFVFGVLFGPLGLVVAACLPEIAAEVGDDLGAEAGRDEAEARAEARAKAHLAAMEPAPNDWGARPVPSDPVNRFLDGLERKARAARAEAPARPPAVPGQGGPPPIVGRAVRRLMGEAEG